MFSPESEGAGAAVLVMTVVVLSAAIVQLIFNRLWTTIVAGVFAIMVGLLHTFAGITDMTLLGSTRGAEAGPGVILLTVAGFVLIAGGALMMFNLRQRKTV